MLTGHNPRILQRHCSNFFSPAFQAEYFSSTTSSLILQNPFTTTCINNTHVSTIQFLEDGSTSMHSAGHVCSLTLEEQSAYRLV